MNFGTSIHCMDGRVQEPIRKYLKKNHNISYVDTITEPGPCKILAENKNKQAVNSIIKRIEISVTKHGSKLIAVSGHYDCAGNPCDKKTHIKQIANAVNYLKNIYPQIKIIGIWVNSKWEVNTI